MYKSLFVKRIMFLVSSFDTISHEKLLYKLDKYGIRGNEHSLIGSYLSNRKQNVLVLGESSDELPVVFGVPQGSVIGPLLFIIYINDIYNSTSYGKFVLFADDTNIFVADKCKLKVFEKANRILKSINGGGVNLILPHFTSSQFCLFWLPE